MITGCWSCPSDSSSSRTTARMLSPPTEHLFGVFGQSPLEEGAEADPRDPERTEGGGIGLFRRRDRVDRQWQLGCQAAQRFRGMHADRIQHVCPRRRGLGKPVDGTLETVGFVADLVKK